MRERGVHQRLHAAHELGHPLRLGPRRLLAQQRLALGLPAQPLGHVRDEAGNEHLAAHLDLRDGRLAREAASVAPLELDLVALRGERLLAVDQRLRRASWRSPNSGGTTSSRIVLPSASSFVQPKSRSAAGSRS